MIYRVGFNKTQYVLVYHYTTPLDVLKLPGGIHQVEEQWRDEVTAIATSYSKSIGIPFEEMNIRPINMIEEFIYDD